MNSDEEEEDEEEDPLWEDPFPSPLSELEDEEEDPPNEEPCPSLSLLGPDPDKEREGRTCHPQTDSVIKGQVGL